ncbi:hypothetical protein GCK72_022264 [Caenorhabditis remanei]|uniref:Uncharacterized protein n=1 Tax=Caenorhabditis remanei TaxID=31234 RepID=A0A6A5FTA9_CAERE|nr:hypothetical protein GCK72_022264 [Caenorhabditis remanei]KAF1745817.1 hypothetical protein GCK72_022264 [Caenorhabditis remanei]
MYFITLPNIPYEENKIQEPARRCKVIIVGAKEVGKSAFIERLEFGRFNEEKSKEKLYRVVSKTIFGQTLTVELVERDLEQFSNDTHGMKQQEMRDVDAMIMFYATDDSQSFNLIKENLLSVQRKIPPHASITIVGSKADVKEMTVDWHDVDTFAESQGFSCFETSSKSGVNVEIILQDILEAVFEKRFSTDEEDVLIDQPVYASTILTSRTEEQPQVNGYCWIPRIPLFSYFRRE